MAKSDAVDDTHQEDTSFMSYLMQTDPEVACAITPPGNESHTAAILTTSFSFALILAVDRSGRDDTIFLIALRS